MATNPYITNGQRTQDARTQKTGFGDTALSAAKFGMVAWRTPGLVGATARAITPFTGGGVVNGIGNAAQHVGKIGFIGGMVGAATAVIRSAQGIGEMAKGNMSGGIAKIGRGVIEGTATALNLTGFLIIPEIASKLFTGKFLTTHLGEFSENAIAGTLNATGNFANSAKGKMAATVTASTAAAAAVMPNGLKFGQGRDTLYAGQVPPGARGIAYAQGANDIVQFNRPQPAPGMSATHFQDMVAAQRGGRAPQQSFSAAEAARAAAQPAFAGQTV